MNKKMLGILVGMLVVAGIVAYVLTTDKDKNEVASKTSEQNIVQEKSDSMKPKSLKEMLSYSGSQKCEFKNTDENYSSEGVVYVVNGKMRGDFISKTAQITTTSHMVAKDNTFYMWEDGTNNGFKASINRMSEPGENQNSVDVNKQMDFSCESWMENSSKFELPSGVEFKDLNAIMESIPSTPANTDKTGSEDLKGIQCAACDSAPESARAQCKAALQCP